MVFGDNQRPYVSMHDWQPHQPTNGGRNSESLILKLQYIAQVFYFLGGGISLSAASIALRELQSEQFDATSDEHDLNGDVPLSIGIDQPNSNPNSNFHTDTITIMAQQIEAMQQQITELERRLEDREGGV